MTHFPKFETKMLAEGLPAAAINAFRLAYKRLERGETGRLSESDISPVADLPSTEHLSRFADAGRGALRRAVVIKLNGGLGTSMGMTQAKSLLPAKNGLTFLEIAAQQMERLFATSGVRVPLLWMNSFRTREDSRAALAAYPDLSGGLPGDFLQNKVPKVNAEGLGPAEWPRDPTHEWCPPGHGDLYVALQTSGLLEELRRRSVEFAFISNSDNLGATLDLGILGWFAQNAHPFAMEVADRTEADKKGGHLARRNQDGRLVLREVAQCPPEEVEAFQNVGRYKFFNTNTLWVNLNTLDRVMRESGGVLDLPLIRNVKTLDPTDRTSPQVFQLETAMGAAISVFEGAQAIRVPRERFIPVKTTNDLLALWSDLYELDEEFRLKCAGGRRPGDLPIDLDPAVFARIDEMRARFPQGAPSLRQCRRLVVRGDVTFGARVRCRGEVSIHAAGEGTTHIPDDAILESA